MAGNSLNLSDQQRFNWLRLWRSANVGPVAFRHLINRFGSAAAALEALPGLVARSGGQTLYRIATEGEIAEEFEAARKAGVRFIAFGEPDYPEALKHASEAPPLLAVRGQPALLRRPMLAIVGSRNASTNGLKLSNQLARELGQAGFPIISGMARGIDRAAHDGALEPGTIAVLAGGADMPYPPQNLDLYDRICGQGVVVSAMPMGHIAQARDFPRRNAIIAGAALAVIVVEAAERSGSLITARMANENGRFVLAAPGFPLDPRSAGCNKLIRDGAILVRDAADVLELVTPMIEAPMRAAPNMAPLNKALDSPEPAVGAAKPSLDDLFALAKTRPDAGTAASPMASVEIEDDPVEQVYARIGDSPVLVDDLIRESGMPARLLHAALTDLELAGRIERQSGGAVFRVLG